MLVKEEILRINSLMGLITESLGNAFARKLDNLFGGVDLFKPFLRDNLDDAARREADDIIRKLETNSQLMPDDWYKLFKYADPSKLAKKLFDERVVHSQAAIDAIDDTILNNINTKDEYTAFVTSFMGNKNTMFGAVSPGPRPQNAGFDNLMDEYGKQIELELEQSLRRTKPKIYDELYPGGGGRYGGIPSKLKNAINDVIEGLSLQDIRTMIRAGIDSFKSSAKLTDEFLRLSQDAMAAFKAGDSKSYERLMGEMRDKLMAVNKNGIETMYQGHIRPKMSREAQQLFESNENGWKYIQDVLTKNPTTKGEIKDYFQRWIELVFPFSKDSWFGFLLKKEWWQRVINTIILQTPATNKEAIALLARKGYPKGKEILWWYTKKILAGTTIVPMVLGVVRSALGIFIWAADYVTNIFGYDFENPWGQDKNETWFESLKENFDGLLIVDDMSLWDLLGFTRIDELSKAVTTFNVTTPENLAKPTVKVPKQFLPDDLDRILTDEQEEHIKMNATGDIFWDTPDYPVEKKSGKWAVYNPSDNKWYEINENM